MNSGAPGTGTGGVGMERHARVLLRKGETGPQDDGNGEGGNGWWRVMRGQVSTDKLKYRPVVLRVGRTMTGNEVGGELVGVFEGIDFHQGSSYLIRSEDPGRLYSIYNSLVEGMGGGLCISRSFPQKMMDKYEVTKGEFIWMTTNTVGHDRCVNPTKISMVHMAIIDFLRSTPQGIVTLEGVEYLISNNGFDPILRLLHALNDKITVSDSILLVTMDEQTVAPREMRILEKDFDRVL